MSLAKRLLNGQAREALCVPEELTEVNTVLAYKKPIKLKRTFDMTMPGGEVIRFWRVQCPGHPNHDSDLSLDGLKDWGIL